MAESPAKKRKLRTAEAKTSDGRDTYLVTGAQGFFGAWIIRELLQGDPWPRDASRSTAPRPRVVGLDLREDRGILNQVLGMDEAAAVELRLADVTDQKAVSAIFNEVKPNYVIHLAGLQIPTCKAKPALGAAVNVLGTLHVFEAAKALRESDPNLARCVVYASSAAVCGGPADYPNGLVTDAATHSPNTHYGVFKLTNEGNARIYWQDHRLPSVGLRPLTVYGVGREVGLTSAPTKAIKHLLAGKPYKMPFTGMTSFDFVQDIAQMFIRCTAVTTGAHTCCIEGASVSVEDFAGLVTEALPQAAHLLTLADTTDPTIPFPHKFQATNLKRLLKDDVPLTSLREGIRTTIEHFQRLQAQGLFKVEP